MQDFSSKRNALFACLDDASKELKGTILDQGDNRLPPLKRPKTRNNRSDERSLSFLLGKESIFKKPDLPITRCLKARTTPDYQMNPHKWKKYSLSDVDISDQTNTAAAFAFLKQMDEQHDLENDSTKNDDIPGEKKIEFKRSSKITRNMRAIQEKEVYDVEVDKPKLKGSKLIMPEYVIGQKNKTEKKRKNGGRTSEQTTRAAGSLKLAHLQEDDDDESEIVGEH